jgi:hypothetical protein
MSILARVHGVGSAVMQGIRFALINGVYEAHLGEKSGLKEMMTCRSLVLPAFSGLSVRMIA